MDKKSVIERELLDKELGKEMDTETAVKIYVSKLERIKASDPDLIVTLKRTADGKLYNMKWGQIEQLSQQTLKGLEFIGSMHDIKGNSYIPLIWIPLSRKFEKLKGANK